MRYYNFALTTNSEQIEKKTKVNLRDYSYDNTICAVNLFMYKNLKNNLYFLIYREEENRVLAIFSYDERKGSFNDSYNMILEMLRENFCINKVQSDPGEITMYQFLDCLNEAKRREYFSGISRIIDATNLWMYYYYNMPDKEFTLYNFKEKIIEEGSVRKHAIYDKSLLNELKNIESHENTSGHNGNMVHYVISARSMEAAADMTEVLMQSLLRSKRISSRRMEIISEIKPEIYKINNHLEEIIENNNGGVIVFDLTERFGESVADYTMTSKYLEGLLKKYRNNCLFVFTYNTENPGFSYMLLDNIAKYVIPVPLREGSSDRKSAINYMKELIGKSEYAKYASQAGLYMKMFPGEVFTQTDVLAAYDKFEPWCLSRNVLNIPYATSGDFLLDRDENKESSYDRLQNLIGLKPVKKQIDAILAANLVEMERSKRNGSHNTMTMHMVFGGSPGTAKTTVAKLFAGIAKEKGILKSGAFVELSGTEINKLNMKAAFTAARGGVLFIDEAYAIVFSDIVTALIQEMENMRKEVIVILAGYNERMKNFMEMNEGLKSRLPYWVDFPDYSEEELVKIFEFMLKERGLTATEGAVKEAVYIFSKVKYRDNFGNGRYVRNLIENAVKNQSVRLLSKLNDVGKIKKDALFTLEAEDIRGLEEGIKHGRPEGTAAKELDNMIGLDSVKTVIHKAIACFKMKRLCMERGLSHDKPSMHMVFTGNPGTAKTTVARLFAEIMKDEKLLPTGNFIEAGRADLVGQYVGTTAPLVKEKFRQAKGGVLFIDEAYSLCDDRKNSYGDEAINTIVQEMENNRENVAVIFAGYPEPMKEFLDRNPGMSSRIAFHVNFEDYSVPELCDITRLMTSKKELVVTSAAFEKLRKIYEAVNHESDYGNGRFVRKILEEAEMNLAVRLSELDASEITTEMLTTIDECDIPDLPEKRPDSGRKIGFAV